MSGTKKPEQLQTPIDQAALINAIFDPFEIRKFAIKSLVTGRGLHGMV